MEHNCQNCNSNKIEIRQENYFCRNCGYSADVAKLSPFEEYPNSKGGLGR
jgi:hypothetical protein